METRTHTVCVVNHVAQPESPSEHTIPAVSEFARIGRWDQSKVYRQHPRGGGQSQCKHIIDVVECIINLVVLIVARVFVW